MDLIERQAAIEAVADLYWMDERLLNFKKEIDVTFDKIKALPSAQPERKKGKWVAVTEDGDVYKRICSCCGQEAFFQNDDPDELYDGGRYELSDFCPHCGADMKEDDHE